MTRCPGLSELDFKLLINLFKAITASAEKRIEDKVTDLVNDFSDRDYLKENCFLGFGVRMAESFVTETALRNLLFFPSNYFMSG